MNPKPPSTQHLTLQPVSSKTMTGQPLTPKPLGDEALLLYGLICVAGADGRIDTSESATLNGFVQQLPDFRGKNHEALYAEAFSLLRAHTTNGRPDLSFLGMLTKPALKKKLFVLAVDLAMSSGEIDFNEEFMLLELRRVLEIDAETSAKTYDVLTMKYAT